MHASTAIGLPDNSSATSTGGTSSGSPTTRSAPKLYAVSCRAGSGSQTATQAPSASAIAAAVTPNMPAPVIRIRVGSRCRSSSAASNTAATVAVAHDAGAATVSGTLSGTSTIVVPGNRTQWLAKPPLRGAGLGAGS